MKYLSDAYWHVRNFFSFLKKLIDYAPILYRDADYDYGYLTDLVDFKLGRMAKCLDNEPFVAPEYKRRRVKQINYARMLLARIKNDDIGEEYESAHDLRWGEFKTWFEAISGSKCSRLLSSRTKANTPEEVELERAERIQLWYTVADLNKKLELRLAKFVCRHYKGWWS